MTVGIVANQQKDSGLAYTCQVKTFLEARGVTITPAGEKADFWVVLGGDGTMLRAAQEAAHLDVPLLGINLGTMGFLTDVDKEDGITALANVLAGRFESQKRLMLYSKRGQHLALNEVLVSSPTGGLVRYNVYVNGLHMDEIRAVGIIVATPTGSTAYNLSAGGPILAPYGQMIVITAVCPHSLGARPCVVSADDTISIVPAGPAVLMIDGEKKEILQGGETAEIARAPVCATIIKTTSAHFYEVLRKKKIL